MDLYSARCLTVDLRVSRNTVQSNESFREQASGVMWHRSQNENAACGSFGRSENATGRFKNMNIHPKVQLLKATQCTTPQKSTTSSQRIRTASSILLTG